jgi:hypothetical protein
MGVSGQRHAPAAFLPPGKGPPVPIVQEAGWAPEPVYKYHLGDNNRPVGDRSSETYSHPIDTTNNNNNYMIFEMEARCVFFEVRAILLLVLITRSVVSSYSRPICVSTCSLYEKTIIHIMFRFTC